jgi:hypothetical protein
MSIYTVKPDIEPSFHVVQTMANGGTGRTARWFTPHRSAEIWAENEREIEADMIRMSPR